MAPTPRPLGMFEQPRLNDTAVTTSAQSVSREARRAQALASSPLPDATVHVVSGRGTYVSVTTSGPDATPTSTPTPVSGRGNRHLAWQLEAAGAVRTPADPLGAWPMPARTTSRTRR